MKSFILKQPCRWEEMPPRKGKQAWQLKLFVSGSMMNCFHRIIYYQSFYAVFPCVHLFGDFINLVIALLVTRNAHLLMGMSVKMLLLIEKTFWWRWRYWRSRPYHLLVMNHLQHHHIMQSVTRSWWSYTMLKAFSARTKVSIGPGLLKTWVQVVSS